MNWTENILSFLKKKNVPFVYYTLIIKALFFIHRKTVVVIVPNMALNVYYFLEQKELERAMASHSSALAWKIPGTEEPGGLQSMGSLRVRHD